MGFVLRDLISGINVSLMFLLVLGGAVYHGGAAIKEKRIKKIIW